MNEYEPFSRLLKKTAAPKKLKSRVSVFLPAGETLIETKFDESAEDLTVIEYGVDTSDSDTEARVHKVSKEFDWDGSTRDVSTEVFDAAGSSGGKNVISTSGVQNY